MVDKEVQLAVVIILGMCAILSLVGMILLAYTKQPIPGELNTLGGVALGGLATLFVNLAKTINNVSPPK